MSKDLEELHILNYLQNKKLRLFKDRELRKLRNLLRLKATNPERFVFSDLQNKIDWLITKFYMKLI